MIDKNTRYKRVNLPNYPFKKERFWNDSSFSKNGLAYIDSLMYEHRWEETHFPGNWDISIQDSFIIFPDTHGYALAFITALEREGIDYHLYDRNSGSPVIEEARVVTFINDLINKEENSFKVLFFMGLDTEEPGRVTLDSLKAEQYRITGSFLAVCKALSFFDSEIKSRLWGVTKHAVHKVDNQIYSPSASSLWGMGATIDLEMPHIWGGCVDVDESILEKPRLLLDAIQSGRESRISLKKGRGYIQRFGKSLTKQKKSSFTINPEGLYLVAGGMGGVGFETVKYLVSKGARCIVVTGRNKLNGEIEKKLESLQKKEVQVEYVQWDIARADGIERIKKILDRFAYPLKGIINSTMIYSDVSITDYTPDEFITGLSSKVMGSWNLHSLSTAYNPDFFILYSSFASYTGHINSCAYTAGNCFQNSLALYRSSLGLPAVSINWGLWPTLNQKDLKIQQDLGLIALDSEDSFRAMEEAAASNSIIQTVIHIDWKIYAHYMSQKQKEDLFSELIENKKEEHKDNLFFNKLASLLPSGRTAVLAEHIQKITAQILEIHPEGKLDRSVPLMEQGVDSIIALNIINKINNDLNLNLSATVLYSHGTINSLSDHLICDHLQVPEDTFSPKPDNRSERCQSGFGDEIAIIGMDCRFPGGADSPELFWKNLINGVDSAGEIPDRWNRDKGFYQDHPLLEKNITRWGHFIKDVDLFDNAFFNIPKNEASLLDPMQRLLLEVSWRALEDSALDVNKLKGSNTGVFVGITAFEYGMKAIMSKKDEYLDGYYITGSALNTASGRLSYFYDFKGPALSVDTACSSSLVAFHLAVKSLQTGESDMALAGGANLLLCPENFIALSRLDVLSPDGRCRSFDDNAGGIGRGEGCGVVVLKRLKDALRDNDKIYAVVKASAIGQDGKSIGMTAPNGKAQEEVIKAALEKGGYNKEDIDYIEAHGTGTHLGDPIEVNAIANVFSGRQDKILIGTVKSNMGHLEAAAGIAGVIKTALTLYHKQIPPTLHFRQPNKHVDWNNIPVTVADSVRDFKDKKGPHVAGISSFGLSGTNSHVLLEEYKEPGDSKPKAKSSNYSLLTLSAKNKKALHRLLDKYLDYLKTSSESIEDICYTSNISRFSLEQRIIITGKTKNDFLTKINRLLSGEKSNPGVYEGSLKSDKDTLVIISCSDRFSINPENYYDFYCKMPEFQAAFDKWDQLNKKISGYSLVERLFEKNDTPFTVKEENLLSFVLQRSMYSIWESWGIKCDGVTGIGIGKLVSASIAQIFTLDQLLRLAAVFDDKEEFSALLESFKASPAVVQVVDEAYRLIDKKSFSDASFWLDREMRSGFEDPGEVLPENSLSVCIELGHASRKKDNTRGTGLFCGVSEGEDSYYHVLQNLSRLLVYGVEVDWTGFHCNNNYKKVRLPHYTFSRKRFWLEESIQTGPGNKSITFDETDIAFIKEHMIYGRQVMPGAGYISALFSCAYAVLENVVFTNPFIPGQFSSELTLEIEKENEFCFKSQKTEHCTGRLFQKIPINDKINIDIESLKSEFSDQIDVDLFYEKYQTFGYSFGGGFKNIKALWTSEERILGRISQEEHTGRGRFRIAPGLIDSIFQTLFAFVFNKQHLRENTTAIPASIERITRFDEISREIWVVCTVYRQSRDFIRADYECYDENGKMVLLVEGFTVKMAEKKLPAAIEAARTNQNSLHSMLYSIKWLEKRLTLKEMTANESHFVLFSDRQGVGTKLQEKLEKSSIDTDIIFNGTKEGEITQLTNLFKRNQPLSIVYLWGLDTTSGENLSLELLEEEQKNILSGLILIIRALMEAGRIDSVKLWIVTENAAFDSDKPYNAISQSTLWGMAPAVATEYPRLMQAVIDIESSDEDDRASLIINEILNGNESRVSYKNGSRFVPRLTKDAPVKKDNIAIRSDASYLITGGTGFLGLLTARWLLEKGAKNLILTGRNKPEKSVENTVNNLSLLFGAQIEIVANDVSRPGDVEELLEKIEKKTSPLAGIIHSAGIDNSALIAEQNWQKSKSVYNAKVFGAWNLHQATSSISLDFFISYSSVATIFSNFGQISYSAANAFLNGLTLLRNTKGQKSISINWGLWAEGGLGYNSVGTSMEKFGLYGIRSSDSSQILDLVISSGEELPYFIHCDWDMLETYIIPREKERLFSDLIKTGDDSKKFPAEKGRDKSPVIGTLIKIVHQDMELSNIEIEGNEDELLISLGFDSLMITTFRTKINEAFNLEITQAEFLFALDTINKLADYICEQVTDSDIVKKEPEGEPETGIVQAENEINSVKPNGYSLEKLFEKQLDLLKGSNNPAAVEDIIKKQLDILNGKEDAAVSERIPEVKEAEQEASRLLPAVSVCEHKAPVKTEPDVSKKEKMPLFPSTKTIAGFIENEYCRILEEDSTVSVPGLLELYDRISVYFIIEAFREMGINFVQNKLMNEDYLRVKLKIVPLYHDLFSVLFKILEDNQIVARAGKGWKVITNPPKTSLDRIMEKVEEDFKDFKAIFTLVSHCGSYLASVLQGRTEYQFVLFADDGKMVEAIYRDSPFVKIFNRLLQKSVEYICNNSTADLNILEIGAGTGSATSYILPLLPPERTKYQYTDLGESFLKEAKKKFKNYNFIDYEKLDISTDPAGQGFKEKGYNIIIASNVLHATSDINRTMEHVKKLLDPEGIVLLLELTTLPVWVTLVFGLTSGWWLFEDRHLRDNSPLLNKSQWNKILDAAGFKDISIVPPDVAEDDRGYSIILSKLQKSSGPFIAGIGSREKMSSVQKRIYTLSQTDERAYHISFLINLKQSFGLSSLQEALTGITDRHESLRTGFEIGEDDFFQKIEPVCSIRIEEKWAENEDDLEKYLGQIKMPYDLAKPPLFRVFYIRTEYDGDKLLFDFHHIIFDGYSVDVLIEELTGFLEGNSLAPLPAQYREYTVNELDYLESNTFQDDRVYWMKKCAGENTRLNLPLDFVRPRIQQFTGKMVSLDFDSSFTGELQQFARNQGATLNMVLLAGLILLLQKLTGNTAISVGTMASGRDRKEYKKTIGMFVNTIVMKTDFNKLSSSEELIAAVKDDFIQSYSHQNYPFDRLIEDAGQKRDVSHNPLFDVMFGFDNYHLKDYRKEKKAATVDLSDINFKLEDALFDLLVNCALYDDRLAVHFKYNTQLFKEETIRRWILYYRTILDQFISRENSRLSNIQLSGEPDKEQILIDFNNTRADYPHDKTLCSLFEEQAALRPEAIAVIAPAKNLKASLFEQPKLYLTYNELNQKANQVAHLLIKKGVVPDEAVGIMTERSAEMIIGIMGILKAGGAYVPLHPEHPVERINFMLEDCRTNLLVTHKDFGRRLNFSGEIVYLDDPAVYEDTDDSNPAVKIKPGNLAYIIYTSGSTGKPKGTMIEHHSVINRLKWMQKYYPLSHQDTILQKTPFTFDVSVWELFWWAIEGAKVSFLVPGGHIEPSVIAEEIKLSNITVIHFVPSMLSPFLEYIESQQAVEKISSLKQVFASGEALSAGQVSSFNSLLYKAKGTKLANLYGPTEATVDVSYYDCSVDDNLLFVPIGKPIDNIKLYVLNQDMQLMPVGVRGQLCISGAGLARGYLNRKELTEEKFVANPYSSEKEYARLYKTGDLARWMPCGNIQYLGRIDNQVKIRGNRIELGEIEHALSQHHLIGECVIQVKSAYEEDVLCAYYVAETEADREELIKFLLKTLPEYMVPSHFVKLEQIPLTANGKADLKALPGPEKFNMEGSSSYTSPSDQLEKTIVACWEKLFKKEPIGVHDNFFNLGGDSIKAVRLLNLINQEISAQVKVADLYEYKTPFEFAGFIRTFEQEDIPEQKRESIYRELSDLKERIYGSGHLLDADNIEDIYPMSNIEKGMVFHSLKEAGKSVYHDQHVHPLHYENIDLGLYKKAFFLIVDKHELLRTAFNMEDFEIPVQIVYKKVPYSVKDYDLTVKTREEAREFITNFLAERRSSPFVVEIAPLWQLTIFILRENTICVVWEFHHAILDGLSNISIIAELHQTYLRLLEDRQFEPDKLSSTYKQYVVEELAQPVTDEAKQFWREELTGYNRLDFNNLLPLHKKGTDRKIYLYNLGTPLLKELYKVCQNYAIDIKSACFAAYMYTISMLFYDNDLTLGLVTHARPECPDGEKIIGCFLNTLPIRYIFKKDLTWEEYLIEVHEKLMTIKPYEKIPLFEITRFAGHDSNSFFDSIFNFFNFEHFEALSSYLDPSFSVEGYEHTDTALDFNLNLSLDKFVIYFNYSEAVFEEHHIKTLCGYYENVLKMFINNRFRVMDKKDILSRNEKELILDSYNRTKEDIHFSSITELIENRMEREPGKTALIAGSLKKPDSPSLYTYRDLQQKVDKLAALLIAKGAAPGIFIGIALPRSVEMITAQLAILRCGAAYVPLDIRYPAERISFMLKDSGAGMAVTTGSFSKNIESSIVTIIMDTFDDDYDAECQNVPGNLSCTPYPDCDTIAYCIYTSGSTGTPKGVLISHKNIHNYIRGMDKAVGFSPEKPIVSVTTISFDIFVTESLLPLVLGVPIILANEHEQRDPVLLKKLMKQYQAKMIQTTPSRLRALFEQGPEDQLTDILSGGEALPEDLLENMQKKSNARLFNVYGPTETTVWSTVKEITGDTSVTIGKPIANTDIYIVDTHDRLLSAGAYGQLCIGGAGVARGYFNRPGLTAGRFVSNPFVPDQKIYKTGDLARWLPGGNLEFKGRIDRQLKIRGHRIEPGEIEKLLLEHPAVKESAVIVQEGGSGDNLLAAYLVLQKDESGFENQDSREDTKEIISKWQSIWNNHYEVSSENSLLNTSGWISSYTGEPIARHEMKQWRDNTLISIARLKARHIMEIGCGTGMILFGLIDSFLSYRATDISGESVKCVKTVLADHYPGYKNVSVSQKAAHDFSGVEPGSTDCIILNSVIQYFPDASYLIDVVEKSLQALSDEGVLFIGDVRNYNLLGAFHASTVLSNSTGRTSFEEIKQKIAQKRKFDKELLISPEFFYALQQNNPDIGHVEIHLKKGSYHNEMNLFRYDVIIYKKKPQFTRAGLVLDWEKGGLSLEQIKNRLDEHNFPVCRIDRIPDKRLSAILEKSRCIEKSRFPGGSDISIEKLFENVSDDLQNQQLDPGNLQELEKEGFICEPLWDGTAGEGYFSLIIYREGLQPEGRLLPGKKDYGFTGNIGDDWIEKYANSPGSNDPDRASFLRMFLQEKLPEYMIPSFFIELDRLPLTPNGKIDNKALPLPHRPLFTDDSDQKPGTAAEKKLAAIWQTVLNTGPVGINISFFDIGGHSLNAISLVSRIKSEFTIELALSYIFDHPTIKEQAAFFDIASGDADLKDDIYQDIPPAESREYYELSAAQKRMFTLHGLEENSTAYNLPGAVEIRGNLDPDRFCKAFSTLTAHHEAFRTCFKVENGKPVQYIADSVAFETEYEKVDDPGKIPQLLQQSVQPFNLDHLPLFRTKLFEISPHYFIFFMDIHHIISDGRSFEVLIKELLALYEGKELKKAAIGYKDFSCWQNKLFLSEKMDRMKEYWMSQFSGEIPVLDLVTDYRRPKIQSFEGKTINFTIHAAETELIKKLALQHNATLYMVLLALYTILLSKYSNSEDIIIGSPVSGRNHHMLENCMGMFVNTLALRNRPEGEKRFADFIDEVRHSALGAFENQDYQFDLLIDQLELKRDLSRNPLFDTMFALQTIGKKGYTSDTIEFIPYEWDRNSSLFDISLLCWDMDDTIEASFEYCTALFDEETIHTMIGHFKNIIKQSAENPEVMIKDIKMISPAEETRLLSGVNSSSLDYDPGRTLISLIEEKSLSNPGKIALSGPCLAVNSAREVSLSYEELITKATNFAYSLVQRGIGPGKLVGLITRRSVEMIIAIIAVQKSGAAYVPIDPDYPAERIQYIINDSGLSTILTGNVEVLKLNSLHVENVIDISGLYSSLVTHRRLETDYTLSPEDLAYVMYTSGSTGRPKGVMVTQQNIAAYTGAFLQEFDLTEEDVVLQQASYSFDTFVEEVYPVLTRGGRLVIIEKFQLLNMKELFDFLNYHKVTLISCSPLLLKEINKHRLSDSVHTYISGGDVLKPEYYDKLALHARVYNTYGPTETTVCAAYHRCTDEDIERVPIGKPVAGYTLFVMDRWGNAVPEGLPGQLWIGGPGVSAGYLGKDELTNQKFTSTSFCQGKVFKTGDLVCRNKKGLLEFLGRVDNQVKIRGFRVEPGEVARQLAALPAIDDAFVHVFSKDDHKFLAAYYCLSEGAECPGVNQLRSFLLNHLPDFMIPSYFIELEKLPVTGHGKIDKKALPLPDGNINTGNGFSEPAGEIEQTIAGIWKGELHLERIGRDDNFFELGGNSLKAISVISAIENHCNTQFPLVYFFKHPTIKDTAGYIVNSAVEYADYLSEKPLLLNGEHEKKIFCFPPLAAYSIYYKRLADELDQYAVYSFGFIKSDDRIKRYADLITEIDAEGPYTFMGYCSGANLAFEVAKELENRGKTVKDIIMFDAARRTDKRYVYPYMIENFLEEMKKQVDTLPGSISSSSRKELIDRSRTYYHYFQELVNTGRVASHIHQIMSEQDIHNNYGWDIATDTMYSLYQGKGIHFLMLERENIKMNSSIVKEQILEK